MEVFRKGGGTKKLVHPLLHPPSVTAKDLNTDATMNEQHQNSKRLDLNSSDGRDTHLHRKHLNT